MQARAGMIGGVKGGAAALALASLAACVAPVAPVAPRVAPAGYAVAPEGAALVVSRVAQPFGYADGAEAKRAAQGYCGAAGVASGPEDNFRDGAWHFPGGCA